MTDKDVEDRLREEANRLAVPFLNRVVAPRPSLTQSDRGLEVLWDEGYIPASEILIASGVSEAQVKAEMAKVKVLLDIIEPTDLISFPSDLHQALVDDLMIELANEPPPTVQRLDERVVPFITELRVEMWSNESQHAGRPHVKVHLKDCAISVSLDPEPVNLTPRGGLVGEASALKVIKKNRGKLLKLWHKTRPDTQRLKKLKTGPSPKVADKRKSRRRK